MTTSVLAVTRLDVQDDREAAAAYAVVRASQDHERPWNDQDGLEATVRGWRYDDPDQQSEMWVARDGDAVIGVALIWLPLHDNVDKVYSEVHVTPERRGHGVGSSLVDLVVARSRLHGRRQVLVESFVPLDGAGEHPHERFAAHVGFSVASTDRVRRLVLPVPAARLDALAGAARPLWVDAYRLETYVDGLPGHLVAGYCHVSNQLAVDAPTGEVDFEAESMTPETYAGYLALERSQGRVRFTTVALEATSGEVVAYTDLVLPTGAPHSVWQWGTLVDREHRGHRLGTAVKVQNLLRVQHDHPERTEVLTGNDETNSHMVSINEALGFELVELFREYHRVLAD